MQTYYIDVNRGREMMQRLDLICYIVSVIAIIHCQSYDSCQGSEERNIVSYKCDTLGWKRIPKQLPIDADLV